MRVNNAIISIPIWIKSEYETICITPFPKIGGHKPSEEGNRLPLLVAQHYFIKFFDFCKYLTTNMLFYCEYAYSIIR